MSYIRRKRNPGKRERAARNRHRRGMAYDSQSGWTKHGSKHMRRVMFMTSLAVSDAEKRGMLPPESPLAK